MQPRLSSALTLLISAFLLVEGVWGLFRPVVFGILTTNRTHAIIEIVLGAGGLLARQKGAAKGYFGFLGSLLICVSVLWLIPSTRDALTSLLNINLAVALVNLLLGIGTLMLAIVSPSPRRFGTQAPFKLTK